MNAIETYENEGIIGELYYDMDADAPYNDGGSPILLVEWSDRWNHYSVEQVNGSSWRVPDEILRAAARFGTRGELDRYLRIFHGASEVETWHDSGYNYVTFDTEAWRDYVGAPRESVDASEYRAFLAGEAYGWVAGDESCWGYYDYDYAMSELRAAVDAQVAERHRERQQLYRSLVGKP